MNHFIPGMLLYTGAPDKSQFSENCSSTCEASQVPKEGEILEAAEEIELVRRMKKGERAAFDRLYAQYYDKLYRTACMITGSRADGEDVTQETFIKMYLHCAELKKDEQFRYWLYRILNRTAWQLAKKQSREKPQEQILELADKSMTADSPDKIVLQDERDRAMIEAVRSLEQRQRTAVILYYYNGLGTKEIARVMECMEGTVKSRLFAARKNLKSLLTR